MHWCKIIIKSNIDLMNEQIIAQLSSFLIVNDKCPENHCHTLASLLSSMLA